MRGISRPIIFLTVFGIFLGAFPSKTAAQCGGGLTGFEGISGLTGNPFQADLKQTFLPHPTALVLTIAPAPQAVARDTQGRVRIDKNLGKFKVQDSTGGETEEERHVITICDPVKGEWITLDTMNKTATIQEFHSRLPSTQAASGVTPPNFCSRQLRIGVNFPGSQTEDLGHRNIEGFDAQGILTKRQMPSGFSNGSTTQVKETTSETETWCSDELGAVVLRNMGTEEKGTTHTIAMINIQRGEPDATLFQIPSGYSIVERVNEPGVRTGAGVIGGITVVAPAE